MLLDVRRAVLVSCRPAVEMDDRIPPRQRAFAAVFHVVVLLDGAIQEADGRRQDARLEPREIIREQLDVFRRAAPTCEAQRGRRKENRVCEALSHIDWGVYFDRPSLATASYPMAIAWRAEG